MINFMRPDASSGVGLASALIEQLKQAIDENVLRPGDRLPPSRSIAAELGVSRGTVLFALETLIAEGLLVGRRGSGTYVSEDAGRKPQPAGVDLDFPSACRPIIADVDQTPKNVAFDFLPCRPAVDRFPRNLWKKAVANAASAPPSGHYGDAAGEWVLRKEIASYLRRSRGLACEPEQVLITNGAVHGMWLLANAYLAPGLGIAVEDPGFPLARQVFEQTGATVHAVPVDGDGLHVDTVKGLPGYIRMVYVTPSHQFPTGSRLSLKRRYELIDWAVANEVILVEDDYDGEFRYDVPPLPPMAAIAHSGAVAYFGTFSKTLFPSLRIGYLVASAGLVEQLAQRRNVVDYQTPPLVQAALAAFMRDGHFERYVLRMRRIYAEKRRCLSEAVRQSRHFVRLEGLESGIDAVLKLSRSVDNTKLQEQLIAASIAVNGVSRYYRQRRLIEDRLVMGYGALTEAEIFEGVERVDRLLLRV